MQVVGTRLRLHRYQSSDRFTELSVVVGSSDLRFCNGVDVRIDDDDSQDWILIIRTVEFVASAAEMLPVHHNLLAALGVFRGGVAPTQVLRSG